MSQLNKICQTLQAEISVKQFIQQLITKTNQGIQQKIIMEMVPQHSIDNLQSLSHNIMSSLEAKHQALDHSDQAMKQPKPIYFDKQMSRTAQISSPIKLLKPSLTKQKGKKQSFMRSKLSIESFSRFTPLKLYELKMQDFPLNSLQLNFLSVNTPTQLQSSMRKRKQDERIRKQRTQLGQQIVHDTINNRTNKQIGSLIYLKKDYTYDQNGSIIPVNRFQKSAPLKPEIKFQIAEKKQRNSLIQPRYSKIKPKMKKTELKLSEIENCFYDNKSPFYKNFNFSKKSFEKESTIFSDKSLTEQLPEYMRILTQGGAIKKRYARYNNQSSDTQNLNQSYFNKQITNFRLPQRHSKTSRSNISKIMSFPLKDKMNSKIELPRTDRIRILNEPLRQKFIENTFRSQTEDSQFLNNESLSKSQIISHTTSSFCKRLPKMSKLKIVQ